MLPKLACVLEHCEQRLHCARRQNLVAAADGIACNVAEGPHGLEEGV